MDDMDHITFLNRIAESSPLIVLVLLVGFAMSGKLITMLLARLDRKDEQIITLSRETLEAMNGVTTAVDRLTYAIETRHRQ